MTNNTLKTLKNKFKEISSVSYYSVEGTEIYLIIDDYATCYDDSYEECDIEYGKAQLALLNNTIEWLKTNADVVYTEKCLQFGEYTIYIGYED